MSYERGTLKVPKQKCQRWVSTKVLTWKSLQSTKVDSGNDTLY